MDENHIGNNKSHSQENVNDNNINNIELTRLKERQWRNSRELELTSNEKYELEKMIRRPSLIPKSPTLTTQEFQEYNEMFENMPLTEETTCGIWFIKGALLQKFANKKAYVAIYGLLGCFIASTYSYFNGTITTLEKRFQIPSKNTGIIFVGSDLSQITIQVFLSYYAGKGHRPRWIAFGTMTTIFFCILTGLPHFLYGPGEDAFQLTEEFGSGHDNNTYEVLEKQRQKSLCHLSPETCEEREGSFYPQFILFMAQFVGGIGGGLFYTLGVSYMDDNIQKSKTPVLMSVSYFLRMLGPALGYALASFSLKMYISPSLTPTITMKDPRWLGAWWLGWIVIGCILAVMTFMIALFPKTLPRAAVRRAIAEEKNKGKPKEVEEAASFSDMIKTMMRLVKNEAFMYNNMASIFYCLGYMPYWIYLPKYIETQYKQSASLSSFVTGTVGLVFSAIGVLSSGVVISKYKPRARILAAWNVVCGAISVVGMLVYIMLGCDANQMTGASFLPSGELNTTLSCNVGCHCDLVSYSPVCSEGGVTFISPCLAGCRGSEMRNGTKVFTECECIEPVDNPVFTTTSPLTTISDWSEDFENMTEPLASKSIWGSAIDGNCPIDCQTPFYIFLGVVCILKFVGATGRASNFLVGIRCVEEKDKTVSIGFSLTITSLFAFLPSPIIFGYLIDTTCVVWGKTCSGTGNCWLYDDDQMRYLLNVAAGILVGIGTFFDGCVWYYVKNLKIFDDEVEIKAVGAGDLGD